MATKSKKANKAEQVIKTNVKEGLASLRTFKRRTVVWPALLVVNEYEFKCMLYDISLGGVRLKLDLPLATGTPVQIKIKDFEFMNAIVSWHAEDFVGLKFTSPPENIKIILGEYANSLV